MSAVADEVREKLMVMGGNGPLKRRIHTLRFRLSRVRERYWHQSQAPGRIKRFLYLAQEPSHQEAEDIRAAFVRFCPERIERNRRENAALIDSIIRFAEQAREIDQDFYQPRLEALRDSLLRLGIDMPDLGRKE